MEVQNYKRRLKLLIVRGATASSVNQAICFMFGNSACIYYVLENTKLNHEEPNLSLIIIVVLLILNILPLAHTPHNFFTD